MGQDEISVAVLGRFKAGKSSFLNHFIGRNILPVGVVPVTAVVTEIRYGVREEARVHHRDGRDPEVPLDQIGGYISEKENPENAKQVDLITVELPELRRFRGLKFVDTPGLESALSHNTQTSLDWLPNVGLALVAVSVDPPLSQRDIDLLKSLYQYTPKVGVLLTKADLLSEQELEEVVEFVRAQLAKNFPGTPQVFPYSTKPGFERFRQALEAELVTGTLERFAEERESILSRKMDTLLRECGDYLALSLKSAEMVQSERQALKQQVIGEKEIVDEVKSAIRLVVQHAAAGTRSMVSHQLETHQNDLERTLLEAFESEFPKWTRSLATMLSSFEDWLGRRLARRADRAFDPGTQFVPGAAAQSSEAGIPHASTISGSLVGSHHAGVRRAVANDGNRDQCRGAQYTRYQSRTSVRQELGTAVASPAGLDDQGRRSPPFCAHDLLFGLSEPQPAQHAVGREHQWRAVGC